MPYGPPPYIAQGSKTPPRTAPVEFIPAYGSVPPELLGIGQVPSLNVPSSFDDAVQNSELVESLGIDPEETIKEATDKFSVEPKTDSVVLDSPTNLGIQLKSSKTSGDPSPLNIFKSMSGIFPELGNLQTIALGIPDLKDVDLYAFGGLGSVLESETESSIVDVNEINATSAEKNIITGATQVGSILGEKLPPDPIPKVITEIVQETEPITDFGESPAFDVGLIDGGDY